ncbi:hypothetical protein ES708_33141 [subsurface metagenome]
MNVEKIDKIKRKILPILKRYNAKRAGIFGSIVRGEENQESDIDILVEIVGRMSLLDFAGLEKPSGVPVKRKFALFLLCQMIKETVTVMMLWLSRALYKKKI